MKPDVGAVIHRVLAGDVEAYADIVRTHQQDVWRIAAYSLKNRAATEDLVQQVFLNAYINLERYDHDRDFGVWLRSIARNMTRNELRRSGRQSRWLRRYHDYLTQQTEDHDAAEEAERAMRDHLERCKEQLAENASRALAMRYEQGLGFDQMAELLGRTVAATRQMLSRIRLALRRCVEERRSHA